MADGAQRAEHSGASSRTAAAPHRTALHDALSGTRAAWPGLGFYERFEQVVRLALTVAISGVVVASLAVLLIRVGQLCCSASWTPPNPRCSRRSSA